MQSLIELAALVVFPVLMAFAASSDLLTMTISNRVSLALFVGFLAMAVFLGLPLEAYVDHLSCGAAVLALSFAFFSFGWIGGGDAKLAAATAIWLGWGQIADYGLLASVLGGFLTLAIVAMRRWPLPIWLENRGWIARLHGSANGIPYGIALAAAGLWVYPDTQIWLRVIGA